MQQAFEHADNENREYKVINESEQYSLVIYEYNYQDTLPSKYWEGREKSYPDLKNGDTGTIDFEFDHPNGFRLAILKINGFEDNYRVIAKRALGNLDDEEIPQPKIIWLNFPDSTKESEIVLHGKIVAHGNVVEFKLNQDYPELNEQNEFDYKLRLHPGRNSIFYFIETDSKTAAAEYLSIENTSNLHNEIYKNLLKNNFLKFSKASDKRKAEVDLIKSNLKEGYFYPPNFQTFYDIQVDYLVEIGFTSYLTEISEGLKKRGCKAIVGEEYQSWKSENTSHQTETHWIEFNGIKEMIFHGIQRDENCHESYFEKLVELVSKALEASKKEEKVFRVTSYDGVFICILTDKQYLLLKEICKPLKNQFID